MLATAQARRAVTDAVRLQITNPIHAGIPEAELRLAAQVNAAVDGL